MEQGCRYLVRNCFLHRRMVSTFRYAQWGQRSRDNSPRALGAACPPTPNSWGWPPGLRGKARRRRVPAVLSSDLQLIRPPGICASSGSCSGSPQLSAKCGVLPSLNKKPRCFPHKLGDWCAPFFLSSSGPLWPPRISPSLCPPSDWSLSSALGCCAQTWE